jgi:hypothetical protein
MKKESTKTKTLQLHRETLRWLDFDKAVYTRIEGGGLPFTNKATSDDGCSINTT